MSISVIVPSFNGREKLRVLLGALACQTWQDFEAVIVLDGSTDGSAEMLEAGDWGIDIQVIDQANKGRSAARNAGIEAARHDLLVFFDDDMRPLAGTIEGHANHHALHPGSLLTGGVNEEVTARSSEILQFKSHLSLKWVDDIRNRELEPLAKAELFASSANMSVSRRTFLGLGGFDPRLNDAEDFDLAVRAFLAGIPVYYDFSVFAWHDDPLTVRGYIRRQRQYAAGNDKLLSLHPDWATAGFISKRTGPTGVKKLLFDTFAKSAWITAMERNYLKFIPKRLRYRLYDYIITANGVVSPHVVL